MKLYMILLGCKPEGRNTEQHDLFFGIANELAELKEAMTAFWKEARGRLHIDAWREVTAVDGYSIDVVPKASAAGAGEEKLFFINLGGYRPNEFEEFHYKMLVVAADKGVAIRQARQTAFFRHTGFAGATAHVDDKYGVDVDDLYEIEDILPESFKAQYAIRIRKNGAAKEDDLHLGYLKFDRLEPAQGTGS